MKKRPTGKYRKRQYASKANPFKIKGVVIFFLLAFLTLLIYTFFTGNKSALKLYTLHQHKKELLVEKERLKVENKQLEKEINKLQNDERYIEEVARKKYNFRKENEEIIIVKAE